MKILSYVPLESSPVTLEDIKQFLKLSTNEDDELLSKLIEDKTRFIESLSGKTMRAVEITLLLPHITTTRVELPYTPASEIISIENKDGVTGTLKHGIFLEFDSASDKETIITYRTTATTNGLLESAVKRLVAYFYLHRGDEGEFPDDLKELLRWIRKVKV